MLSHAQIKHLASLHQKKFRRETGLFLAEGEKVIFDLLHADWKIEAVYVSEHFQSHNFYRLANERGIVPVAISQKELERISTLSTPQHVLAVIQQRSTAFKAEDFKPGSWLVLDEIRDPGNLGTIIRIADWFGIDGIICSEGTVECYNPKVVQAAMGSLFRVSICYHNLIEIFSENQANWKMPVYGTLLEGESVYTTRISKAAFLLMGSESNGIRPELLNYIDQRIRIPDFSRDSQHGPDSLNVAVATGILCAEWRRP